MIVYVLYGFKKGKIILCYPDSGISKISLVDFLSNYPSSEPLRFALPRRNATSLPHVLVGVGFPTAF